MGTERLDNVFSEYIRRRDSDENGYCKCFTCPEVHHWKEMQNGHGISRKHLNTRFDEQNNHAQCQSCNEFQDGKEKEYKAEVDRRYGPGTWEALQIKARRPMKLSKSDISALIKHFQSLNKLFNGRL